MNEAVRCLRAVWVSENRDAVIAETRIGSRLRGNEGVGVARVVQKWEGYRVMQARIIQK